ILAVQEAVANGREVVDVSKPAAPVACPDCRQATGRHFCEGRRMVVEPRRPPCAAELQAELERVRGERDAARTALARLRAKVGPVVEWWRAYEPALIDIRRIVPVLARRLDALKAGWED